MNLLENDLKDNLEFLKSEVERLSKLENSLPASLKDAHQILISLEKENIKLKEALENIIISCKNNCDENSYCGQCAVALMAIGAI